MIRRAPTGWAGLLALVCSAAASAQTPAPTPTPGSTPPIQGSTTVVPAATVSDTLIQLGRPVGAPRVGEALGLATRWQRTALRQLGWISDKSIRRGCKCGPQRVGPRCGEA